MITIFMQATLERSLDKHTAWKDTDSQAWHTEESMWEDI